MSRFEMFDKIKTNKSYSSVEEIRATIEEAMKYVKVVAPEDVPSYEPEDTEEAFDANLSVWDEEHNGEVIYHVHIDRHYIGGDDFKLIFSYTII